MIHDNLRKMIRRWLYEGTGETDTGRHASNLEVYDYTDITGYKGSDETNDSFAKYISDYYLFYINSNSPVLRAHDAAYLLDFYDSTNNATSWPKYLFPFICIGNSIDNEPDYTLGSIIETGYTIIMSKVNNTKVIKFQATLQNTSYSIISFDEIGLFRHYGEVYNPSPYAKWNGSAIGSSFNKRQLNFLLIKEKLSQPITIPVEGSITINIHLFGDTEVEVEVEPAA